MSGDWVLVITLLFDVLLVGALFWKMPDWSRPELLFGVTVPADVRRGEAGREVIGDYRHRVLWVTIVCFVAACTPLWLGGRVTAGMGLVTLVVGVHLAAMFWAFLSARRRVLPLAATPSGRRVASIAAEQESLPGGWIGQAGPFLVFAAVVGVVIWAWPQIPDRFVTHWNGSLEPDGWSDKSVASVFGLAAVGLAVIAMLPPIAWSLMHRTRRVHVVGEAARVESGRRRAVAVLLLWLEYLLAVTFAPLMLTPLVQSASAAKAVMITVIVLAILGPLAMIIVWFVRYGSVLTTSTRAVEAAPDGAPIGDRTEDRFWKWGMIYYNPDDPVLWVEKRFGVGYTFNMARPSAWLLLGGMIGVPLVVAIAVAVAA